MSEMADKTRRIRVLNDAFRVSFDRRLGRLMLTQGVANLPIEVQKEVLDCVSAFKAFTADNDPHGEHDFGSFELVGQAFFFKFDYYAPDMEHGSEDPSDANQTRRVLTLMLAEEY
jgi:Protein of unknown function (DUF3768)